MKTVAFYQWQIWNLQGTKKVKTRHLMTEEVALARHPEAVKVKGTCETRTVPETDAELTESHRRPSMPGPGGVFSR